MGVKKSGYVRDEQGDRVVGQTMRPGVFELNEAQIRPPGFDPLESRREEMRYNMRAFGVPPEDIERRVEENMMNLRRRVMGQ